MPVFRLNFIAATLVVFLLSNILFASNGLAETFSFLGPSGGRGGNYYSDAQTGGRQLIEVRIRSGAFIDAIQTVYVDAIGQKYESKRYGGGGGNLDVFKLQPGEYITRISGKYGSFVDSLLIQTNKGRAKGWGGTGGSANYTYTAPPGSSIHGFFGRSGRFIDSVGVILKTP